MTRYRTTFAQPNKIHSTILKQFVTIFQIVLQFIDGFSIEIRFFPRFLNVKTIEKATQIETIKAQTPAGISKVSVETHVSRM